MLMLPLSGTVDVVEVDLDDEWDGWWHVLDAEEHARAARYATVALGRRFLAGRAALRLLLSERCGIAAGDIALTVSPLGKPALASTVEHGPHFNVSHTGRHALMAFAAVPIGIDVEIVRHGHDIDALAAVACHSQERKALLALPEPRRTVDFHRMWTRKEAYAKALGLGMQIAPDTIRIDRDPDADEFKVFRQGVPETAWSVFDLPAPRGCVASVCVPIGIEPPARITKFDPLEPPPFAARRPRRCAAP